MSAEATVLLGQRRLVTLLQQAIRRSRADATLIACERRGQTTLRFANGCVHQNFHSETADAWVKVACDGRVGIATTNAVSADALRRALETAMATARRSGPSEKGSRRRAVTFGAAQSSRPITAVATYVLETVIQPIAATIRAIHHEWRRAERMGYRLAGSFTAGEHELAVVGSRGLARYQPFTVAGAKVIATKQHASGYAAETVRDLRHLDIPAIAQRAVRLAQAHRDPRDLPLGRYDCLLEPDAVADLLEWLGYIAFGTKMLAERTSCLAGRLGDRIMGANVSIADDALHPAGLAVPFDYEGTPTQRVALIERGVATGVVYDSHYGALYNHPSTGHAMPYDETEGPLPTHLTLASGTAPRATMERLLGDGLVISRLHYVNGLLDTRRALMTGLTRDGTLLVRRGKAVGAVKNARFTQSILEAFSRVAALSRERRLIADPSSGLSSCLAPTMLIRGFTFTGQTR